MKIGICNGNLSLYETLISLGYDFVEVNNTYIHGLSEDEFASLKAFADAHPGFIYSCNCLIPGDLRLTGPDVDFEKIRKFCLESFSRMNDLGVKMLVFGSSKAKTVPEGFPMEKAWQQLVEVTRLFAEIADSFNMRVCIEPLRYAECNIINTAYDSAKLVELTDRPNVGAHVDFYHMMQNGEKLSCLKELGSKLIHTHVASPVKRSAPTFDDGADYASFFRFMRNGGYDGTVSFEGGISENPADLKAMLEYLRSCAE